MRKKLIHFSLYGEEHLFIYFLTWFNLGRDWLTFYERENNTDCIFCSQQQFSDPEFDDSSIVMTSIVPLRLVKSELIIWENPNPSSTFYYRPVKFTFTKETAEFIQAEHSEMQREIAELVTTHYGDVEIATQTEYDDNRWESGQYYC